MEFHEQARDSVRDLFEAQVANFRVLDLLRVHDVQVEEATAQARARLENLDMDVATKSRVARQIAQTFVQPLVPDGEGEIEDTAYRMNAKTEELAGLAMLNLPERDFTGLTIRRDLSARSRESMLVTLWSDFEAFVAELFRLLATVRPAPLVPNTRQVKLSDVVEHQSVEALTKHLAQQVIEDIFRYPFEEWIAELCRRYSLDTPGITDTLRESYLRRNVVVHAGAVANSQYLEKLKVLDIAMPEEGERLTVDRKYLETVADQLASVAFALAIGAVGKYDAEGLEQAEGDFTNLCYILLIERRPGAVQLIGSRYLDSRFKTHSAKEIMKVNFWLACRDLGTLHQHVAVIEEWDVGALDTKFQLAKLILTERFDEALASAKHLRDTGGLQERLWRTWPLFRDLRALERERQRDERVDEGAVERDRLDGRVDPDDHAGGAT